MRDLGEELNVHIPSPSPLEKLAEQEPVALRKGLETLMWVRSQLCGFDSSPLAPWCWGLFQTTAS